MQYGREQSGLLGGGYAEPRPNASTGAISNALARALCLNTRPKAGTNNQNEPSKPTLDLSLVCHEVRGLDTPGGDQAYVAMQDVHAKMGADNKVVTPIGDLCCLKAVEFDTTLLLSVCADETEGASVHPRILGEVRLPLRHLMQEYASCLYYTWITLEMPGLQDSVNSLGFRTDDETAAFDHAIAEGPKNFSQPKACISLCQSSDVGSGGKIICASDSTANDRAVWWVPLLRSQQQHIVLSAALHLKCERQGTQFSKPATDFEQQERSQAQAEEIGRLKAELQLARRQLQEKERQLQEKESLFQHQALASQSPSLALQDTQDQLQVKSRRLSEVESKLAETEARSEEMDARLTTALAELEAAQAQCEKHKREADELSEELEKVSDEANQKIEQANRGIRTLKQRREDNVETEAREEELSHKLSAAQKEMDEMRLKCERYRTETHGLQTELDRVSNEANQKIAAANNSIRTLKQQREEAEQELQRFKILIPQLQEDKAALEADCQQLSEQKEALLQIVDDLHQTCIDAGIEGSGRHSIDNTLQVIRHSLRNVNAPSLRPSGRFSFT